MCGMLWIWRGLCVLVACGLAEAGEAVRLAERVEVGEATRVTIVQTARGTRPGVPARVRLGGTGQPLLKAGGLDEDLPFQVETRLEWLDRVRRVDAAGRVLVSVRRLELAKGTIDFFRGRGQTMVVGVRPELLLLLAERRDDQALVVSAGGPLTRAELDLVQTVGDPLQHATFLPERPVVLEERWELGEAAARAVSDYETIVANSMRGKLAALDEAAARIELTGEVRGSIRGAEGTIAVTGEVVFDRVARRVSRIRLERSEQRKAGPVESALDVKSTVEVQRKGIAVPEELSDAVLRDLWLEPDERRALLQLEPPGGRYRLVHDRQWHLVRETNDRVVLRRMEGGAFVAQCDLVPGPNAGRGRHQDPAQFEADVRQALGDRLGSVVGVGEVGGAPAGGFRYKLAMEGLPDQNGVVPLWYYYLVAGPSGDQVLGVFTLSRATESAFGDQDLRMIGSLEWNEAGG